MITVDLELPVNGNKIISWQPSNKTCFTVNADISANFKFPWLWQLVIFNNGFSCCSRSTETRKNTAEVSTFTAYWNITNVKYVTLIIIRDAIGMASIISRITI